MPDPHWENLKETFHAAVALAPAERAAYLDRACSGNNPLRQAVESLIRSHEETNNFVDAPAYQAAAGMLVDGGDLKPSQTVAHYKIISPLGEGGMGKVYLAEDTKLHRKVSLKFLSTNFTQDHERLRRFEREGRAASALNHPNILTIHEISETDGQRFITTEFIDGQTLRERLRSSVDIDDALDIAIQVAAALVAAHRVNIVHRDIKPENIMIRREDGLVKVLDFGLAKITEPIPTNANSEIATQLMANTSPGLVMGTAAYMSPEQARGDAVDERTDIWSLGVVLYEMVAGCSPFVAASSNEIISAILSKDPLPPLARYSQLVPARLEEIVEKALTKNRDERYQTSKDLLIDLKRLKKSLELKAGIERSTSPETFGLSPSGGQLSDAKITASEGRTPNTQPTSSAEYIVNQVKSHKRGVIVLVIVSVGLLAALSVYKYFNRGGSESHSTANSQAMKLRKLTSNSRATIAAISPDGKYVVHSQEDAGRQSLWLKQVATLSEVQIVPPAEVKYFGSTFTPDGSYLYYVMGEKNGSAAVYQISAVGGTPRKILQGINDGPITLSPDGKRFAFLNQETSLWTANADGSGERELATRKRPEFDLEGGLAWSPDGRVIACSVRGVDAGGGYYTVVGVNVESGEQKPITTHRWYEVGQVAWRTDGSGLVLVAEEQVWQLSYPGGEARKITNDANQYIGISLTADSGALVTVQYDVQSSIWVAPSDDVGSAHPVTSGAYEGFRGLSWTPDGKIVYSSNASGSWNIWLMAADGTGRKQLTADVRCCLGQPSVSADGRYIVFPAGRTGTVHIWRINIDGSDPHQLTNGGDWPECSPDGKWVVYASYASGPPNLWKVRIEGGDPVPVTGMISDVPAISPDGKLIAFRSRNPADQFVKISVMSFADGRLLKVFDIQPTTMMKGDYKVLRWTPDGGGLAYIDTRTGADNIWARPLDGGPERQLTDFKSEQIFKFAWSRDGKQLAVTRGAIMKDVILISGFE